MTREILAFADASDRPELSDGKGLVSRPTLPLFGSSTSLFTYCGSTSRIE